MLARAYSGTIVGIEAKPIVVETHRGKGLPGLTYSDWHGQRRGQRIRHSRSVGTLSTWIFLRDATDGREPSSCRVTKGGGFARLSDSRSVS